MSASSEERVWLELKSVKSPLENANLGSLTDLSVCRVYHSLDHFNCFSSLYILWFIGPGPHRNFTYPESCRELGATFPMLALSISMS